jgi:hypothetical protein
MARFKGDADDADILMPRESKKDYRKKRKVSRRRRTMSASISKNRTVWAKMLWL